MKNLIIVLFLIFVGCKEDYHITINTKIDYFEGVYISDIDTIYFTKTKANGLSYMASGGVVVFDEYFLFDNLRAKYKIVNDSTLYFSDILNCRFKEFKKE
jgi:hypothetical protein